MVEDLNLQWSTRARDLALGVAPAIRDRLRVTGGVAFDRYRLYEFATKGDWMTRYGLRFERMVGYASWTFDRLERDDASARSFKEAMGDDALARIARDRDGLRETLSRLSRDNPDTLFLLKEHPGVVAPQHSEIAELDTRENVMVVRDEEPVADCIAACDVWTAFDSTTCLEAWLLDKPTLLINPTGADFERDETHRGSAVFGEAGEVQAALDSWYRGDGVPGFAERAPARREVIEDTIQWDDGKNHLRAVHYIEQLLAGSQDRPRLGPLDRAAAAAQRLRFRFGSARRRFDQEELAGITRRSAAALDLFDGELTQADRDELARINREAG
jgi:hypothetical protein